MYKLHLLGWHSFQQLCHTVLKEELGQTVQPFLETNDGGRDGAFSGQWQQKDSENLQGNFVVQCKFTSNPNSNLSTSKITEEVSKAKKLVETGHCDIYILMTNSGISGSQDIRIKNCFTEVGVKHFLILGSTWLCDQIRAKSKLRMLVPRLYGLGDLSQILDGRAYSQARSLLDSMSEDLAKVVVTSPYRDALEALNESNFVMLIGEPAAGKTTIASLLTMAAIDQWKSSPLKLDTPEAVKHHWNPDEPSQIFWIDDAFGATQYEQHLALGWNRILIDVKSMISKGAKIIMTSRDYIYSSARSDLKQTTFPLMDESKVVIKVQELELNEKKQILYNHIKLGSQPRSFKTEIKPLLDEVANHDQFSPEIARRLSEPLFTEKLHLSESCISEYVEKKEHFLEEVLLGLDDESKAALALIYMRNGSLDSPIELDAPESKALNLLGGTSSGTRKSLSYLNGTLVRFSTSWRFKHPTIGDAYASLIAKDPELLGIYIQGASIKKLFSQITCGDVKYTNAIIIGPNLYPLMIDKLDYYEEKSNSKRESRRKIHYFLALKCSKEFLELYLKTHENFLNTLRNPGHYFSAISEVNLILKLGEVSLLPSDFRENFISLVTNSVLNGDDSFAIESRAYKKFLSQREYQDLISKIEQQLIPNLSDITYHQCELVSSDQAPNDHVSAYRDLLNYLLEEFSDNSAITEIISDELDSVQNWVEENNDYESEEEYSPPYRQLDSKPPQIQTPALGKSFFDDIDA